MVTIIVALILIAATLINLLDRLDALTVPEQYAYYPGVMSLFIGLGILFNGCASILIKRNERLVAAQNSIKEDHNDIMDQILEQQRLGKQQRQKTTGTDEVIYDEDAI